MRIAKFPHDWTNVLGGNLFSFGQYFHCTNKTKGSLGSISMARVGISCSSMGADFDTTIWMEASLHFDRDATKASLSPPSPDSVTIPV